MMIPQEWPDYLDYLLAKSAKKGAGGNQETLAMHTWSVLTQLAALIALRPSLPEQSRVPRLWHILFWAAFLHDFGKAAKGFQERLRGGPSWPHRHEVLSLTFLDWITSEFTEEDQLWLAAAIVSHHKDAEEIRTSYNAIAEPETDFVGELDARVVMDLWRWLATCPRNWIATLGLVGRGIGVPQLPPQDEAVRLVLGEGPAVIRKWLNKYNRWVEKSVNRTDERWLILGTVLLRGHVILADHMASAHAGELPEPNLSDPEGLLTKLHLEELYSHQQACVGLEGSAVLMAPTGSGKTEAALLWAVSQHPPRLYYALPFQASMNAMEQRLGQDEKDSNGRIVRVAPFKNQVGLEHSRSLLAYFRRLLIESEIADPKKAAEAAKWLRNLSQLSYYPVRVLSPYQLLKAPYQLKGYETLLTDCYGGAFVFDEVHAYEAGRLAKILALIKYLRENYRASFMIMSATLPRLLRDRIREALGDFRIITASADLYKQFRRHRLCLSNGDLLADSNLDRIAAAAQAGQSVLVCCNTVVRAQSAWRELQQRLEPRIEVVLLHGRFNGRDRLNKEALVRKATGVRSDSRQPIVLVATQVVEVSLDIDLDVLYTDPAPLEAMLQRFGRINRKRRIDLAPVYVFCEPIPDKPRPYQPELVRAALELLDKHQAQAIDEAQVSSWLDEIYRRPEIAEPWTHAYQESYDEFSETAIKTIRAFQSDAELEEAFYQAFDSVDVLPAGLYDQYLEEFEHSPLQASELLVPVRWWQYKALLNKGRARLSEDGHLKLVDVHYDSLIGLDLSREAIARPNDIWESD